MSETPSNSQENEESRKKSVLEEKSKEELVKIVKKQLILLQKAKGKSDELSQKCHMLDEEKKTAIESQECTILELQQEVGKLKKKILELKDSNKDVLCEKNSEISLLKEHLKYLESEKSVFVTSLNEKEEQIQCFSLQLKTFKETCQCLQEDLSKQQKQNEEFKAKIIILNETKDNSLDSLKSKSLELESLIKEHSNVINESTDLQNKYSICIEENCSLTSKIEFLESEIKNLQNSGSVAQNDSDIHDFSILITENQKLQSELSTLKDEYCALKKTHSTLNIESDGYSVKGSSEDSCKEQATQEEFSELKKEQFELQKSLCATEGRNSELTLKIEIISEEKESLFQELEKLKEEYSNKNHDVDCLKREKLDLKNEIKRLTSSLQEYTDFQGGIEHALLQGATTESVTFPKSEKGNVEKDDHVRGDASEADVSDHPFGSVMPPIEICDSNPHDYLEFGLLGGGSINEVYDEKCPPQPSDESAAVTPAADIFNENASRERTMQEQENKIRELKAICDKVRIERESLEEEIKEMRIRFDEYANLLQDTISENETLKLKIADREKSSPEMPYTVDFGGNTDAAMIETQYHENQMAHLKEQCQNDLLNLESTIVRLNEKIDVLTNEKMVCVDQCSTLKLEVNTLHAQVKELTQKMEESGNSCMKIQEHADVLEKENWELSEKLEKKCEELSDFNYQVELLVNSVKQGARQKSFGTTKTAERDLTENMNEMKSFLDELLICGNRNAARIATLESDLNDVISQKQSVYDELDQVRELNQFLEIEVEQLKTALHPLENRNRYEETQMQSPNELYSIEEIDEKNFQNDSCTNEAQEGSVESTSTESSSSEDNDLMNKEPPADELNALKSELEKLSEEIIQCKSTIANFNEEKEVLKSTVNEKSILVERIHCEMDSLLEKIESLNEELHEKDDDLKCSRSLIVDLRNKLRPEFHLQSLKSVKDSLNELNTERDRLKSDILKLNKFSYQILQTLEKSVVTAFEQSNTKCEYVNSKCSHLEQINHFSRYQIGRILLNLDLWLNMLDRTLKREKISDPLQFSKDDLNSLKKTFQDVEGSTIPPDGCKLDCCLLTTDVQKLLGLKQNLFHSLFTIICEDYDAIVAEVHVLKTNTVPNFEIAVSDLKSKLQAYESSEESRKILEVKEKSEGNEDKLGKDVEDGANLKDQLAETEVKMNKFKQIAVKLKKELVEIKKQNNELKLEKDKLATEQLHYVQNYQSLQNEYDKNQDDLELQKENVKKLQGDLSTTLSELSGFKEKYADLDSELNKSKQIIDVNLTARHENEKWLADSECKIIVLESSKEEKIKRIEELEGEIKDKIEKINSITEENNALKHQLEYCQKEEKKKTLLDLEIADYERSILELNSKVEKKDEEIVELKGKFTSELEKNQSLLEEIQSTETLKETEEKRAENFKEILEKTKLELSTVKERESELLSNVDSLRMQLEVITQQEENCKLQLSETAAEVQHLKEMINTSSENHQRIVRSLESKVSHQKQEILGAHKEVENIKQEFENYKIRVHSVLKQQKSTTPTFTPDDDVKEKLEAMVEKLKMQVRELNDKLTAVTMESETLQEEHDNLLQRHHKVIEDGEKKDADWLARLEQINLEKSKLRSAQEELSSQHLVQNEMLVSTYKKQIKIMSEEHKKTVNDLQKQLESADLEIARFQRDHQKSTGTAVPQAVSDNTLPFDIFSQERQEGEGSENIDSLDTPIPHLSLATIPTTGFLPFEKLLQSSQEEPDTPTSFSSSHEYEKLLSDMHASNKKIDHLSEVLNDSESSNLRLSEQVRVLKEEVRRLERNQEREQHAENLEYLKNVFLKFATLGACSEKAMLIPVLTTMLKLSPNEQQQLKSIAGDMEAGDNPGSGWGNYLHRWSGLR